MGVDPGLLAEARTLTESAGATVRHAARVRGLSRWPGGEYYYDSVLVAADDRLLTFKVVTSGTFKKQEHVQGESTFEYADMTELGRDRNTGALSFKDDPQEVYLLPIGGEPTGGEKSPAWEEILEFIASRVNGGPGREEAAGGDTMGVNREVAEEWVRILLDEFEAGRWQEIYPGSGLYVVSAGMIFGCTDNGIKIGFGVRSSMTPTGALLEEIADQCGRNHAGHVWLAPGSDNDHWSVVWGVKLMYGWCSVDSLKQLLLDCHHNHDSLLQMVDGKIAPFGGQPYWPAPVEPGVDLGARGMVLASHVLG